MKSNKNFTIADMIYKNRFLISKGRTIFDVYASFVKDKVVINGDTTYIFNDSSKLVETKSLKIRRGK
jgi:hypothetical protein